MTHYRTFEPLLPASAVVHGRAMVIAPHPDDEVIGCGGVILGHRERGVEVDVVVMTDGGRGNPTGQGGPDYTALRREESRQALLRIGGATTHFLDYPDGTLKDSWKPVEDLVRLFERLRPASVFFPSPYEIHPDHRATSLMVFRALRAIQPCPRIYLFEIGAMMPANLLVNITPYMLRKEDAITVYHSQLLHQDLIGKVRALNRARTVNVDDPDIRYVEALCHVEASMAESYLAAVEQVLTLTDNMPPSITSTP